MKKLIFIICIFLVSCGAPPTVAEKVQSNPNSPCNDRQFKRLQGIDINNMNEREYEYYKLYLQKCEDYRIDIEKNTTTSQDRTTLGVVAIIGILVGTYIYLHQ